MRPYKTGGYAKKSLGQNFLIDEKVIAGIIASLEVSKGDSVLEIGPGRGALTSGLLDAGADLTALEIDRELVPQLNQEFGQRSHFRCIEGDVLEVELRSIVHDPPAKLVGNLPYYISTAILQKLSEQRQIFSRIVLMLQKEVVDRIVAKPGDSSRGYLTVLIEDAFESMRLFDVPPSAFVPRPKVESTVVLLVPRKSTVGDEMLFREIAGYSFAQKRKTILNNLKHKIEDAEYHLAEASIDPRRRAETLTSAEWAALVDTIAKKKEP